MKGKILENYTVQREWDTPKLSWQDLKNLGMITPLLDVKALEEVGASDLDKIKGALTIIKALKVVNDTNIANEIWKLDTDFTEATEKDLNKQLQTVITYLESPIVNKLSLTPPIKATTTGGGHSALVSKKGNLTAYLQRIIDDYKGSGIVTDPTKFEDELNKYVKDGSHFHTGKSTWKEEVNQVSADTSTTTGDLGDTKDALLYGFADYFCNAVLGHGTFTDDEKKNLIKNYIDKRKDANELAAYNTTKSKKKIEALGLTVPTTAVPLTL